MLFRSLAAATVQHVEALVEPSGRLTAWADYTSPRLLWRTPDGLTFATGAHGVPNIALADRPDGATLVVRVVRDQVPMRR